MNSNSNSYYLCPNCNVRVHKVNRSVHQIRCHQQHTNSLSSLRKRRNQENIPENNVRNYDSNSSSDEEEEKINPLESSNYSSSSDFSLQISQLTDLLGNYEFDSEISQPNILFNDSESAIYVEIFQVESGFLQFDFDNDSQHDMNGLFMSFLRNYGENRAIKKHLSAELFVKC